MTAHVPLRRGAFTVTEVLLVLALAGILLAAAFWALRPPAELRSARAFVRAAHAARISALAGTPTAVVWRADLHAHLVTAGSDPCHGPARAALQPEPRVAVVRSLPNGLAWLPDGSGRSCSGGGVYGGRIVFQGPRGEASVVVASSGRLRIEAGP